MNSHPDHNSYIKIAKRQRIDTAIHTLEGLLRGVSIDGHINEKEAAELTAWCDDYRDLIGKHPFEEIVPRINAALERGALEPGEQTDLVWVCQNFSRESNFYGEITSDIQVLQGILHGVLADALITQDEAAKLTEWVETNSHLKGCYPFDELDSLLTSVLQDGKLDDTESHTLKAFFEDFINYSLSKRIQMARESARLSLKVRVSGICATCPDIQFSERVFCFTGASTRGVRRELSEHVLNRGGTVRDDISKELSYLVVGAGGNPCWAFSCYGRKIEEAVTLRKNGHRLLIVHENDFWDALEDSPT